MAADVELLRAGWLPMPTLVALLMGWQIGEANREYEWAYPIASIDMVELRAAPSLSELLEEMYNENDQRASSEGLLKILSTLFELTGRRQFAQIEWLLQNSGLEKLAPEFAVGILRSTANNRPSLPSWSRFREAVRRELRRRNLNANQILAGLGGENETT